MRLIFSPQVIRFNHTTTSRWFADMTLYLYFIRFIPAVVELHSDSCFLVTVTQFFFYHNQSKDRSSQVQKYWLHSLSWICRFKIGILLRRSQSKFMLAHPAMVTSSKSYVNILIFVLSILDH